MKKIGIVFIMVVFVIVCSGVTIYGGQTENLITEEDLWHPNQNDADYTSIKDSKGYIYGFGLNYMGWEDDTSAWHKKSGYMAYGIPTVGEKTQAWSYYDIPSDAPYLKAIRKGDFSVLAGIELGNKSAIQRDTGDLEVRFHYERARFSGYISKVGASSSPIFLKWDPVTINTPLPKNTKTIFYRLNAYNSADPLLWGDIFNPANNPGCWVMFRNPYLILRDNVKPSIKTITLNSNTYVTGETIGICVEFDENVNITGLAPTITLDLPGNPIAEFSRSEGDYRFWFSLGVTSDMDLDNADLKILSINNLTSFKDVIGNNTPSPFNGKTISEIIINNGIAPTIVAEIRKDIYRGDIEATGEIDFEKSDFKSVFTDRNGDSIAGIFISTLPNPQVGILKFNDEEITAGTFIPFNSLEKFKYKTRSSNELVGCTNFDGFTYKVIDSSVDALESNTGTIAISLHETLSIEDFSIIANKETNTNINIDSFINNTSYKNSSWSIILISGFIFKTLPDPEIGKFIDSSGNDITQEYKWGKDSFGMYEEFLIGDLTFVPTERIEEGTSFEIQGIHMIDNESNIATVTINADLRNIKPTIQNIVKICEVGRNVMFSEDDFVSNYTDLESEDNSNMEKIKIISIPSEGNLMLSDNLVNENQEIEKLQLNQLKFIPADNGSRNISFLWQASDSDLYSDSANISIVMNNVPIVQAFQVIVNEDAKLQFSESDFSDNFQGEDVGDTLELIKIKSLPAKGLLKLGDVEIIENQEILLSDIGGISFEGEEDYNGTTSFLWQGKDGYSFSNTTEVAIVVNPMNDFPRVSEIIKYTEENINIEFTQKDFQDAYTDIDKDPLTTIRIVTIPESQLGTLSLGGIEVQVLDEITVDKFTDLVFEPKQDVVCKTSFAYHVYDGVAWQEQERGNVVLNVLSQNYSVDRAKEMLSIEFGAGDSASDVKNNVLLTSEGLNGTNISWESSDLIIISDLGVVNRPSYGTGDKTVILTATITKGNIIAKKTFEITVTKKNKPYKKKKTIIKEIKNDDGSISVAVKELKFDGKNKSIRRDVTTEDFRGAESLLEKGNDGVGIIRIDMLSRNKVVSNTIQVPSTAISSKIRKYDLLVSTNIGEMTLPANMLDNLIGEESDNIQITMAYGDKERLAPEILEKIGDRPLFQFNLAVDGEKAIWNNPLAPVSLSMPYTPTEEELASPENITVWYIDGQGNTISVPSGRYNTQTGRISFTTTHFSDFAVVFNQNDYNDIEDFEWAKSSINALSSKGIFKEINNGEYNPKVDITRADFLYYLVRTLDADINIETNFDDINSEDYYYKEIAVAKSLGITNGVGNNKYEPNENITRQDMMVLTERALRIMKKIEAQGSIAELEKFEDVSYIKDYAINSIGTVVKEGLILGSEDKINPLGNTTRAEAAVLLYRIYNMN